MNITYLDQIAKLISNLKEEQSESIADAAKLIADAVAKGNVCHLFGSGHSVIPAMDLFPRYGSFVGFNPLLDPRLMWFNVIGPGGAPELLWIERSEGYIQNFLNSADIRSGDVMMVYSHGGLNAAPIEAALYAKEKGCKIISVTSLANSKINMAKHSSGNRLCDVGDVVIDNCAPPEDSLVKIEGLEEPVGASSTVSVVVISMSVLSAAAELLVKMGVSLEVFVSPNVNEDPNHNKKVFAAFQKKVKQR